MSEVSIYVKYAECRRRAAKKYAEKNRSKLNEYCKIRYNNLKNADDEKYQKQLIQKREYYFRKKAEKKANAVVESETPNEVDEIK
jgi:hypothetical protein